jgi:YfiR/HmsC-like
MRPTSVIAVAWVLAAALAVPGAANAADSAEVETRLKVAYIYNFARFVEWPLRASSGPVRIGVLGHGDLGAPLEEVIRGKSANGRPIEVALINSAAEADCCQILVIERSEYIHVGEIVQALAGKPVLTVCDVGRGLHDGVMIAFQLVEESVRFQINQEAAEHAGLKISSQLLKVAVPSPGRHQ